MKLTGLLSAGGLVVALACCGGGESPAGTEGSGGSGGSSSSTASGGGQGGAASSASASSGTGGAAAAPVLTAEVSPSTVVAGASVTVTVSITNFTFVAPKATNVDGEGHYHVYLDAATGGNYLANGQTPTKVVKIPAGTAPGPHTLRVSVSDNGHTPLDPPVEKILDITVQ